MVEPRYELVADSYGGDSDDYSLTVTRALLDLTGSVDGRRVLDVACGHGLIAREMARRGATVVGVDLSPGLLERGQQQEQSEPLGVRYLSGDAASPTLLTDEQFDLVVCSFGLSDIDDLDGTLANVSRWLAPGGAFVFSILHPCFPGLAGVSGAWPTDGRYYDERWWRADGELSTLRAVVGANHRMLSTYLNALGRHDLSVDRMEEPPPNEDWVSSRPGSDALPVYLAVRCVRNRSRA